MPLFFGDFLASTAEWEGEERGLYLLLLGYQWSLGSLPDDTRKLCKLIGWDRELFERCWITVRAKFYENDGRLVNERLELHREKSRELSKKNSESGKRGAAAKWQKTSESMANATNTNGERHEIANSVTDGNPSHPIPSHPNPSHPKEEPRKDSSYGTVVESSISTAVKTSDLDQVKQVFEHWKTEWDHPGATLDAKRSARIRQRLKAFSPQQLCEAISGFRNSDWHTGRDPRGGGKVYDKIETLLREDSQVEEGMRLLRHPPKPPEPPRRLSIIEQAELDNQADLARRLSGGHDERVVSEQGRQSFGDVDGIDTDVRSAFGTRLRTIGP